MWLTAGFEVDTEFQPHPVNASVMRLYSAGFLMTTDERDIRHLVATWHDANRAYDFNLLCSLMTDDAILLFPGQKAVSRLELAKAQAPTPGAPVIHIDHTVVIKEIEVHGNCAFLWEELTLNLTNTGTQKSTTSFGHQLMILKKVDEQWLIARTANLVRRVG